MRRTHDPLTQDLFEVPAPRNPLPGALAIGPQLRALISEQIKGSPLSRFDIAARMSELTGQEISKNQLDAWTAESREGWRFPLEYLPALEVTLETHTIMAWLADLRGCRMLVGKEALEAKLGKLSRMREDITQQERVLKKMLGATK